MLSKALSCSLALAAGLFLTGCGHKEIYPVHGRIVDPQGAPVAGLEGGAVEFQSMEAKSSANGSIDAAGQFTLTTKQAGDGAHVGKNRVAITKPYFGPERPAPQVIDPKYENPDTSGLEVTVEPKDNEVTLTVELAKSRRR
jgi:hypothetical protein